MPITREQLLIPGARFRVVERSYFAEPGDIVTLAEDDGTILPFFHAERAAKAGYRMMPIPLSRLDLIDPAPAQPAVAATGDGVKTLRDEFAMAALNGMLAHGTRYKPRQLHYETWHAAIAEEAYELADAMLAARAEAKP